MKCFVLFTLFAINATSCLSQKPLIDSSVYDKWPAVDQPAISNDGNYALYMTHNQPFKSSTLTIQTTHTNWKMEIPAVGQANFTSDSRIAVFMGPNDSLGLVSLNNSSIEYVPFVLSFKLPEKGHTVWLAYQVKGAIRELITKNLITGEKRLFPSVTDYKFNEQGTILALQTEIKGDTGSKIQLITLTENISKCLWSSTNAHAMDLTFDKSGTRFSFITEGNSFKRVDRSLWLYQIGMNKAKLLVSDQSLEMDSGLTIENIGEFTPDGGCILFHIRNKEGYTKPSSDAVKVDIWSYGDSKLQSQQLTEGNPSRSYLAIIHLDNQMVIRLEYNLDHVWGNSEDIALVERKMGDADNDERNWNPTCNHDFYLVSTRDGSRKFLTKQFTYLSPSGKFVIFYDPKKRNFFCYSIVTGKLNNITKNIATNWTSYGYDFPSALDATYGLAGWLQADAAVLIYDQNDIWQVDLSGYKPPVNITNRYGKRHNIQFHLALSHDDSRIMPGERLILTAFNRINKDNGFYGKILGKVGDPELLTMGPYMYYIPADYVEAGEAPIKARDIEAYLVRRVSASESANYFFTNNFKTFSRLSKNYPEKKFNWLTTELMTWKKLDGRIAQGILYKPENFDPGKKYPVILNFYEKLSDELHQYIIPQASDGDINIPTFVSNGYLIFRPDISYVIGEPGQSAFNSILSAAKYLAALPWVNGKKIGIQGMSWGGYETNYLVTHTHIFAAAMSASGPSDFVSGYGSLWQGGKSCQALYELYQSRIGVTLWERPDLFIKNSPIFNADKVTTPLLLMNNKMDDAVPFGQGVELFTALRRLRKKSWMLQYDNGLHGLERNGKEAYDYSIRVAQFFDHYLKDARAPEWMINGIPASRKGIETGFDLDTSNKVKN